jgi:hypothetical protein
MAKNYPALIAPFVARGLPLVMFIAVGDDERPIADPRWRAHDLDYEAHTLYNKMPPRAEGHLATARDRRPRMTGPPGGRPLSKARNTSSPSSSRDPDQAGTAVFLRFG